ncbi:MAG: hypothetical protein KO217_05225 [Methanobacteriaceae archaeon]|jgi:DNA-directed RNA polymerase subunit RPC12/RpoP|nr:hypothetical protein [Methanobacteriaceae archaeon]
MKIEPWKLKKSSKCYNCGDATIHEINIDQYKMTIRCKECGFTRYYTFHILETPE